MPPASTMLTCLHCGARSTGTLCAAHVLLLHHAVPRQGHSKLRGRHVPRQRPQPAQQRLLKCRHLPLRRPALLRGPQYLLSSAYAGRQVARFQRRLLGRRHGLRRRRPQLSHPPRLPHLPWHLRGHYRPLAHAHQQPVVYQIGAGSALFLLVSRPRSGSDPRWRHLLRLSAHHPGRRPRRLAHHVRRTRLSHRSLRPLHFLPARYPHARPLAVGFRKGRPQARQRQPDWHPGHQISPPRDARGPARPPGLTAAPFRHPLCLERRRHHLLGHPHQESRLQAQDGRYHEHALGYRQHLLYPPPRLRHPHALPSLGVDITCIVPAIMGGALMSFLKPHTNRSGVMAGIYLVNAVVAPLAIFYNWTVANCAGGTKRAFVSALVRGSFSLGNIIGPHTFQSRDAPDFRPAKLAVMGTQAGCALTTLTLFLYYVWANKRRNQSHGQHEYSYMSPDAWAAMTDKENRRFRYSY